MHQYLVDAYTMPSDGRVRRYYQLAASPDDAYRQFLASNPDAVVRSIWVLVPPTSYAHPPSGDAA